jgi:hypothetical protein
MSGRSYGYTGDSYTVGPVGGRYPIEGVTTSRQISRTASLTITGTGDATTVTLQLANEWNSDALAQETVDTDTPTGGTRFDVSANGQTLTIKGLTQTCLVSRAHHIHSSDVGTDWNIHIAASSGNLTVAANNATTGAAIDFAAAALNGKVIQVNFEYLTST